jgi:hypothetical protein
MEGAMPFVFTNESDRRITAGALQLYAEDCRKFAELDGALAPAFRMAAVQAERLADEIGRAPPVEIEMDRNGAGEWSPRGPPKLPSQKAGVLRCILQS